MIIKEQILVLENKITVKLFVKIICVDKIHGGTQNYLIPQSSKAFIFNPEYLLDHL